MLVARSLIHSLLAAACSAWCDCVPYAQLPAVVAAAHGPFLRVCGARGAAEHARGPHHARHARQDGPRAGRRCGLALSWPVLLRQRALACLTNGPAPFLWLVSVVAALTSFDPHHAPFLPLLTRPSARGRGRPAARVPRRRPGRRALPAGAGEAATVSLRARLVLA